LPPNYDTPILTITLEDIEEALNDRAIGIRTLTGDDLYVLRKCVQEGLLSGSEDVYSTAVDIMLDERVDRASATD